MFSSNVFGHFPDPFIIWGILMKPAVAIFFLTSLFSTFAYPATHYESAQKIFHDSKNITPHPEDLVPSCFHAKGYCVFAYRPDDLMPSYLHFESRKDPIFGWVESIRVDTYSETSRFMSLKFLDNEYVGQSPVPEKAQLRRVYLPQAAPHDEFLDSEMGKQQRKPQ